MNVAEAGFHARTNVVIDPEEFFPPVGAGGDDRVEARPSAGVAPRRRIGRGNDTGTEKDCGVGIDGHLIARKCFRLGGILISAESGTVGILGTRKIDLKSRQYKWTNVAEVSAALRERRDRLVVAFLVASGSHRRALKAEFLREEKIGFVLIRVEKSGNVNRAADGAAKVVSAEQRGLWG